MPRINFMRQLIIYGAILFMSFSLGCGGCEDETSTKQDQNYDDIRDKTDVFMPDVCEDNDNDGFFYGLKCAPQMPRDCNDTVASINPDAMEICDDRVDNNCDGQVDEGCRDCEEVTTKPCSSDVGTCKAGIRECVNGSWSNCSGVEPAVETCDGKDNDCDGEIDEDPQVLCDDGLLCNGTETCSNGTCETSDPPDCSAFDSP